MGRMLSLTAADGKSCAAYPAEPDGATDAAIVVIQEIFGVNGHIRDVCDRFAEAGYAALAPALFDRAEPGAELDYTPEGIERGRNLRAAVGDDGPLADLEAAIAYLREGHARVGAVGFCWGGSLAWLSATRLGADAAVGYYGGQIAPVRDEKPGCPVLLHFGGADASIPPADVEAIRAAHPDIPVHVYEGAGHGFNCDRRASFHPEASKLAWSRTLNFLGEHLTS